MSPKEIQLIYLGMLFRNYYILSIFYPNTANGPFTKILVPEILLLKYLLKPVQFIKPGS